VSELLDLRTVNATWHVGPCAEVRVGEHVTRYVRRGSGPSVVLLGADADANPLWSPLLGTIAANHRVIIPQLPPDGVDQGMWLRGFIEGLGLSAVVVIAGPALCEAALDVAAVDDFTVRKLVLLPGDAAAVGYSGARALWVQPEWSQADGLQRVLDFLDTEEQ
jgi:hypothetical protein